MGKIFLIYLFAYLAGSVNFAIIFFKLTGKEDPRLSFSGNAGTTNVYRQAGYFWATVILLLDIGRALAVAVVAVYFLEGKYLPWAGFFLVLGNSFPCFHGFRGGKGVANYLGFTVLIAPWAALIAVGNLACCLRYCPDYFHCFIFHDFYFGLWTGFHSSLEIHRDIRRPGDISADLI